MNSRLRSQIGNENASQIRADGTQCPPDGAGAAPGSRAVRRTPGRRGSGAPRDLMPGTGRR